MSIKTVLITGAATRIGAAIAEFLHRDGMDIIIHYNRSTKAARELEQRLNNSRQGSAITVQADLLQDDTFCKLQNTVAGFKGELYALVNNASSFFPTPLGKATSVHWDDLVGTNLKAPFFLSQQLAPLLARQQGTIINITDIYADRPMPNHTIYCLAKAGLVMLTRSLAIELAPDIRVNAIAPGAILWPAGQDVQTRKRILENIPLGDRGTPTDIASTVRFLICDAGYITGQVIPVDGGRSVRG